MIGNILGRGWAFLNTQKSSGLLSGNALKILAALTMTIDHAGMLLFPRILWLRVIGRLAFPIYAFLIAQGCRYTRNRLRYFLSVFLLGLACQAVYFAVSGSLYLNVLLTFSLSIGLIYLVQQCREMSMNSGRFTAEKLLWNLLLLTGLVGVWLLNQWFTFDYGFFGCLLPVFAAAFQPRRGTPPDRLSFLDRNFIHVSMLGLGLVLLSLRLGGIQSFSLLALPLLYAYSGLRGNANLKTLFYLFYPAHLVILEGLRILFF